jgi:hypothetical protein
MIGVELFYNAFRRYSRVVPREPLALKLAVD